MIRIHKYFFFYVIFISSNIISAQNLDSLKRVFKNAKHDSTKCLILKLLYIEETDNNLKRDFVNQRLKIAESNLPNKNQILNIFFLKQKASSLNNIGALYYSQSDLPKAIEFYNKSLKIREEIGDKSGIASSLGNIGIIYNDQGDIANALDYYYKSLKIHEEINDKAGIAASLDNIGGIFENQGNIPKALDYYLKGLKIYREIDNKTGIAGSLSNIGIIYNNQGNIPKALEYFSNSLKLQQEIGDDLGIANSLNNFGDIYRSKGDISAAIQFHQKSLKIREEIDDKIGIVESLNKISDIDLKNAKVSEAFVFASKGMLIAKDLGFPENIKNLAQTLKKIFQKQNKYKEAFEMYELFIKMRDSINNQETQKATIKKQMQYTYEKKELETKAEQDKKDVIAKAELKQKENERNYFIAGFGLVVILALFILRGYKQKQKANAIILEQKHLVDEKQKEILDSIHYAKRIQTALLPSEKYIDKRMNQLKKRIFTCVFCVLSFISFSQNTNGEPSRIIDSLKLALKNAKHDTIRCNILNTLIENEADDNIWPKYNEQLLKLAKKGASSTTANITLKNFYLK